jgi:hypothetical protein
LGSTGDRGVQTGERIRETLGIGLVLGQAQKPGAQGLATMARRAPPVSAPASGDRRDRKQAHPTTIAATVETRL